MKENCQISNLFKQTKGHLYQHCFDFNFFFCSFNMYCHFLFN